MLHYKASKYTVIVVSLNWSTFFGYGFRDGVLCYEWNFGYIRIMSLKPIWQALG